MMVQQLNWKSEVLMDFFFKSSNRRVALVFAVFHVESFPIGHSLNAVTYDF